MPWSSCRLTISILFLILGSEGVSRPLPMVAQDPKTPSLSFAFTEHLRVFASLREFISIFCISSKVHPRSPVARLVPERSDKTGPLAEPEQRGIRPTARVSWHHTAKPLVQCRR